MEDKESGDLRDTAWIRAGKRPVLGRYACDGKFADDWLRSTQMIGGHGKLKGEVPRSMPFCRCCVKGIVCIVCVCVLYCVLSAYGYIGL